MSLFVVKNDKGEWLSFDSSRESVWYTNNPTFFNDRSYAEAQAGPYGHVVELVEAPAKIVVSEDMASWLSDAKEMRMPIEFLARCKVPDGDQEDMLRAYVNGWVVEKLKRWNVKVPHTNCGWYFKCEDDENENPPIIDELGCDTAGDPKNWDDSSYFTAAEIEHYGLQDCERVEIKQEDEK